MLAQQIWEDIFISQLKEDVNEMFPEEHRARHFIQGIGVILKHSEAYMRNYYGDSEMFHDKARNFLFGRRLGGIFGYPENCLEYIDFVIESNAELHRHIDH